MTVKPITKSEAKFGLSVTNFIMGSEAEIHNLLRQLKSNYKSFSTKEAKRISFCAQKARILLKGKEKDDTRIELMRQIVVLISKNEKLTLPEEYKQPSTQSTTRPVIKPEDIIAPQSEKLERMIPIPKDIPRFQYFRDYLTFPAMLGDLASTDITSPAYWKFLAGSIENIRAGKWDKNDASALEKFFKSAYFSKWLEGIRDTNVRNQITALVNGKKYKEAFQALYAGLDPRGDIRASINTMLDPNNIIELTGKIKFFYETGTSGQIELRSHQLLVTLFADAIFRRYYLEGRRGGFETLINANEFEGLIGATFTLKRGRNKLWDFTIGVSAGHLTVDRLNIRDVSSSVSAGIGKWLDNQQMLMITGEYQITDTLKKYTRVGVWYRGQARGKWKFGGYVGAEMLGDSRLKRRVPTIVGLRTGIGFNPFGWDWMKIMAGGSFDYQTGQVKLEGITPEQKFSTSVMGGIQFNWKWGQFDVTGQYPVYGAGAAPGVRATLRFFID